MTKTEKKEDYSHEPSSLHINENKPNLIINLINV